MCRKKVRSLLYPNVVGYVSSTTDVRYIALVIRVDLGKTVIKIQCSYKISMKQKMCLSHDFSSQSPLSGLETQVMSYFFLGKVVT